MVDEKLLREQCEKELEYRKKHYTIAKEEDVPDCLAGESRSGWIDPGGQSWILVYRDTGLPVNFNNKQRT